MYSRSDGRRGCSTISLRCITVEEGQNDGLCEIVMCICFRIFKLGQRIEADVIYCFRECNLMKCSRLCTPQCTSTWKKKMTDVQTDVCRIHIYGSSMSLSLPFTFQSFTIIQIQRVAAKKKSSFEKPKKYFQHFCFLVTFMSSLLALRFSGDLLWADVQARQNVDRCCSLLKMFMGIGGGVELTELDTTKRDYPQLSTTSETPLHSTFNSSGIRF